MYFPKVLSIVIAMLLTGCMSGDNQMLWGVDEGVGAGNAKVSSDSRPALDVPPSLRGTVEVPDAESIAVEKAVPERYKKTVAGKNVALDARLYDTEIGLVFSSVVDAMTALNYPVQSVDSASGTVTTDWIRTDADNPSVNALFNAFGGGGPQAIRYRFVTRVLRESTDKAIKTRLEIRTMAQVFQSGHWVNKRLSRKRADDLFSRVEELLAR